MYDARCACAVDFSIPSRFAADTVVERYFSKSEPQRAKKKKKTRKTNSLSNSKKLEDVRSYIHRSKPPRVVRIERLLLYPNGRTNLS